MTFLIWDSSFLFVGHKGSLNFFLPNTGKGDHIPIHLDQGFSIWTLRISEIIFSCGAVLCFAGCLIPSLVLTH